MDDDSLERGLAVVEVLAPSEPSVADVVDALEAIVDGPDAIRTVLATAEARGLIDRDGQRISLGRQRAPTSRRGRVIRRDGEFSCRRCGRSIGTGHFLRTGSSEIGPYGSTCIDRLMGRD